MDNVEASGRCCAGEECREDVCQVAMGERWLSSANDGDAGKSKVGSLVRDNSTRPQTGNLRCRTARRSQFKLHGHMHLKFQSKVHTKHLECDVNPILHSGIALSSNPTYHRSYQPPLHVDHSLQQGRRSRSSTAPCNQSQCGIVDTA
jgi:hypothetical protein